MSEEQQQDAVSPSGEEGSSLPSLRLVSYKLDPFMQRAALLMRLKGVDHELEFVDLAHKPEGFEKRSPLGKVPVLEVTVDGTTVSIWGPGVILEYLDSLKSPGLLMDDPLKRAKDGSSIDMLDGVQTQLWGVLGQLDAEMKEKMRDDLAHKFGMLENKIVGPFFHGETITMLDVAMAPILMTLHLLSGFESTYSLDSFPKLKDMQRQFLEGGRYGDEFAACLSPDYAEVVRSTLEKSFPFLFQEHGEAAAGASASASAPQ